MGYYAISFKQTVIGSVSNWEQKLQLSQKRVLKSPPLKRNQQRKKNLVIVESPAKAKTIEKYLGRSYKVVASVGHIRDLKKSSMSIDFDNNYEPQYINIRGKGPLINSLKKRSQSC